MCDLTVALYLFNDNLDKVVCSWLVDVRSNNGKLSEQIIREKALNIPKLFGYKELQENENILQNNTLKLKELSLIKSDNELENNLDLLQPHDSEVNAKHKMKPKREELPKNGNSEVNNVENYTENIDSENFDTEIDTDLDNSEMFSIDDPKQDFIPLNNFSNQTNQIVDTLIKNLVNCYNYSNDRSNGPFPINLFLGSNISVVNYIFLPSNITNGYQSECQPISDNSSTVETTLSSITLEETEENIENASVTDMSQMGTTQPLTSELELNESKSSLSSIGITNTTVSDTISSSITTEEVTNTAINESTTLNDSNSESESSNNCVSSDGKTCPTSPGTVCYTLAIDQENNISNVIVTEPLQPTEPGLKTTPLSSISSSESIVTTNAGVKKDKISKQKSATTNMKIVKKPTLKSKHRAKKHQNGDSKHRHRKRKKI